MKLSYIRYEEIKEIVADLYEELGINKLPVNAFEIATKLGIKVIPYSGMAKRHLFMKRSEDGFFCQKDDDSYWVYYNEEQMYERVNYTIAHELAHIKLNHTQESELAEAEANFFAEYLLAPPSVIRFYNFNSPEIIAEKCHISISASMCAFRSFKNRCRYGSTTMTSYELKIHNLFSSRTII